MAWCATNGIDLSSIAATMSDPKGARRDIGEIVPASDGTMRATRQVRKHDLSFQSIPLSGSDARAWEALLAGEGQVWSFDSSYYGSKGTLLNPSNPAGTSVQSTTKKFGAKALKINTAGDLVGNTIAIDIGGSESWTLACWWKQNTNPWHHIVRRSDGAKWLDGARNDAAADPFNIGGGGGFLTLLCATGPDYFDDFVAMPGLWPSTWPTLVYANGFAFSPLPYLNFSGDLVPEAPSGSGAFRTMIGKVDIAKVIRANPTAVAGGASKVVQVLQVDLQEK